MAKLYKLKIDKDGEAMIDVKANNKKEIKAQLSELDDDSLALAMVYLGNFKDFVKWGMQHVKQDNMLSTKWTQRLKNNASLICINVLTKMMSVLTVPTMRQVCAEVVKERGIEDEVRELDNDYQEYLREEDSAKSL